MESKNLFAVMAVALVVIGIVAVIGFMQTGNTVKNTGNGNVTLIVSMFGKNTTLVYAFQNETALQLLEENNTVNVSSSKYGDFVNCINSVCSGNNYYWMYYINGKSAQVGASGYYVKSSDIIEFRYEKE